LGLLPAAVGASTSFLMAELLGRGFGEGVVGKSASYRV